MSAGANLVPGVRSIRLVRTLGARGLELLALMLDAEPARLRKELAAVRPRHLWSIGGLLAALCCIIGGTIAVIVQLTSSSEIVALPAEQAAVRLESGPSENDEAIVTRPLFYRSRQAAAPVQRSALPVAGDPQVRLRGVLIDGDRARAFLVSTTVPRGVWRQTGEEVAGWRVAQIFADRVMLESQAGQLVVPLAYATAR